MTSRVGEISELFVLWYIRVYLRVIMCFCVWSIPNIGVDIICTALKQYNGYLIAHDHRVIDH